MVSTIQKIPSFVPNKSLHYSVSSEESRFHFNGIIFIDLKGLLRDKITFSDKYICYSNLKKVKNKVYNLDKDNKRIKSGTFLNIAVPL